MVNKKHNTKKKVKKVVTNGIAHVHVSLNNTIVLISDIHGNSLCWSTSGSNGFKGSKKSTPYAAQIAAEKCGKKALEFGMKTLDVKVKGIGPGRDSSIRTLNALGFNIQNIIDVTSIAHNGCRPSKKRRI